MAFSGMTALANDSNLVTGGIVASAEHDTHRTNYRTNINSLLTECIASEKNRASASQPTDKGQGTLWADIGSGESTPSVPSGSFAILRYYKDNSADLEDLVGCTATQTLTNKTLVNPVISGAFTGALLGPPGLVGAPSYSFTADPTSGFYQPAVKTLGFSIFGVLAVEIDPQSNLLLSGISTAVTSMTNGLMMKSGTQPSAAPASGSVAWSINSSGDVLLYSNAGPGTNGLNAVYSNAGNLLLGGLLAPVASMIGGIQIKGNTQPSVAPASGSVVIAADSSGNLNIYTNGGPGANGLVASFSNAGVFSLLPPGTILSYGGVTAPANWLVCDGTAVSKTTYANLFAIIGTTYGIGDGSTTFNLPDFRGRFVRGFDNTAGVDTDASTRTAMVAGTWTLASCTKTNTSPTVGVTALDYIAVGMHMTGTGIPANTYVRAKSAATGAGTITMGNTANTANVNATDGTTVTVTFDKAPSAAYLGSVQADQFKTHTHNILPTGDNTPLIQSDGAGNSDYGVVGSDNVISISATQASGGTESRPKNAYIQYIIKI